MGGDEFGARCRAYGKLFGFESGTSTDKRSFDGREGGIGEGIWIVALVVLAMALFFIMRYRKGNRRVWGKGRGVSISRAIDRLTQRRSVVKNGSKGRDWQGHR